MDSFDRRKCREQKRNKAFVPPDGTKPIAPTKDERKEYVDGRKEGHNPLLSREDAKRLATHSGRTEEEGVAHEAVYSAHRKS